jgi:protein gp37
VADKTNIEWTDATWNPIRARRRSDGKRGWFCEKYSPGCKNCYAARMNENVYYGNGVPYAIDKAGDVELYLDEKVLEQPLHWRRPRHIFPCSMTDLFGRFVPEEWITRIIDVMRRTPWHTYQVLTKRAVRFPEYFSGKDALPSNVWLGVSVEDPERAEERIMHLANAPVDGFRWVSVEPLLGMLDLFDYIGPWGPKEDDLQAPPMLDWVVVGGESGPDARPMHPDWVRLLRAQCRRAKVPFFFKQWGNWAPVGPLYSDSDTDEHVRALDVAGWPTGTILSLSGGHWDSEVDAQPPPGSWVLERVGKKKAGAKLDGVEVHEWPGHYGAMACLQTSAGSAI